METDCLAFLCSRVCVCACKAADLFCHKTDLQKHVCGWALQNALCLKVLRFKFKASSSRDAFLISCYIFKIVTVLAVKVQSYFSLTQSRSALVLSKLHVLRSFRNKISNTDLMSWMKTTCFRRDIKKEMLMRSAERATVISRKLHEKLHINESFAFRDCSEYFLQTVKWCNLEICNPSLNLINQRMS